MCILRSFAEEYNPMLILLEDIQFFDTISLQLVADTVQQLSAHCLVITTQRPNSGMFVSVASHKARSCP